jgi:hypothetical protein
MSQGVWTMAQAALNKASNTTIYLPLIKAAKGIEAVCNLEPFVTAECEERYDDAALEGGLVSF